MTFLRKILEYLNHFVNLIYPNYCMLCQSNLHQNESVLCTICEVKLPYTNYHNTVNNPIEKKLWGRVPIQKASSLLFFEKGLEVQQLISNLKYKNREDVGEKLAEIYAGQLQRDQSEFLQADLLIPIPLHFKKQKRRGYNQCDSFTITLSEKLNIPFSLNSIERKIDTISQTGKSRIKRWENVSEIFKVVKPEKIKNKHILLIDDVMTTGATLEALANKILEVEGTKVSILVMASAI